MGAGDLFRSLTARCASFSQNQRRRLSAGLFRLTAVEREAISRFYLAGAETIQLAHPQPALPVECRGRKDGVFLELAIVAGVTLVTGDRDLLTMRGALPLQILTAVELRALVQPTDPPWH